jgi:hypothetical protein
MTARSTISWALSQLLAEVAEVVRGMKFFGSKPGSPVDDSCYPACFFDITPTIPSSPVPRSNRLEGSGAFVMAPAWKLTFV